MSPAEPLRVVLCWHMHQPQYRDLITDEHVLPWTYLHAIKDYVDMAVHLEAQPGAAAVVNFSPILIEQIRTYSAQISAWLRTGRTDSRSGAGAPDARRNAPGCQSACRRDSCLPQGQPRTPHRALCALQGTGGSRECLSRKGCRTPTRHPSSCWTSQSGITSRGSARPSDSAIPRAQELIAKERDFNAADCRQLIEIIGDILSGLLPRYRRLLGSGQVELSVTPYGHPILPLMLDFRSARESQPALELPVEREYPGGDDRARWHIARAIQSFVETFGVRPKGCWPAEGGVSERTLALFDEFGFDWIATGGAVLRNSLAALGASDAERSVARLHRPYRLADGRVRCFFRHDGLSDLIGFTYSKWHGDDAAANLVEQLEHLHKVLPPEQEHVVAIVLDGENAWEYYPFNGYYFLKALYEKLSEHPQIRLTTFSRCLADGVSAGELQRLIAGSWVYGNFSTWIGNPGKNRAWEMLCEAKRAFDRVVVEGSLSEEEQNAAERQLGVCEGSDWCWWFGDENPAESVRAFDNLYRRHLANLYRILEEEAPAALGEPIAYGHGTPEVGGVMKRSA